MFKKITSLEIIIIILVSGLLYSFFNVSLANINELKRQNELANDSTLDVLATEAECSELNNLILKAQSNGSGLFNLADGFEARYEFEDGKCKQLRVYKGKLTGKLVVDESVNKREFINKQEQLNKYIDKYQTK